MMKEVKWNRSSRSLVIKKPVAGRHKIFLKRLSSKVKKSFSKEKKPGGWSVTSLDTDSHHNAPALTRFSSCSVNSVGTVSGNDSESSNNEVYSVKDSESSKCSTSGYKRTIASSEGSTCTSSSKTSSADDTSNSNREETDGHSKVVAGDRMHCDSLFKKRNHSSSSSSFMQEHPVFGSLSTEEEEDFVRVRHASFQDHKKISPEEISEDESSSSESSSSESEEDSSDDKLQDFDRFHAEESLLPDSSFLKKNGKPKYDNNRFIDEFFESEKYDDFTDDESVNETITNRTIDEGDHFKVFLIPDEMILGVIQPPVYVELFGKAEMLVLNGQLSVLGHVVDNSCSEYTPVYSNPAEGPVLLQAIKSNNSTIMSVPVLEIKTSLEHLGVGNAFDKIMKHLTPHTIVVSLRRHERSDLSFSDGYVQSLKVNILPKLAPVFEEYGFYLRAVELSPEQQRFTSYLNKVQKNFQERKAYDSESDQAPCVIACGPKNVGKSTALRSLINYSLNLYQEVLYLDVDPGQSEFAPSGCLSLTKVSKPLLGPPYSHLKTPEKSYFLGHISPSSIPTYYSNIVQSLVEYKMKHFSDLPLFVNTMGYLKGVGLSLFIDVLRYTKPTDIIQLDLEKNNELYSGLPKLNLGTVYKMCGWVTSRESITTKNKNKFHCYYLISKGWKVRAKPRDLRNSALLAYFGHMFLHSEVTSFWDFIPYRVPWSSVAIGDADGVVPKQELMYLINGNLIGLCKISEDDMLETEHEDYPKFIKGSPFYECFGFGIIRAIDPVDKVFFIITPEPQERLKEVNALIKGPTVDLPVTLFVSQVKHMKGKIPYFSRRLTRI